MSSELNQQYLDTRLFGRDDTNQVMNTSGKSHIAAHPVHETFQKKSLAQPPPNASAYSHVYSQSGKAESTTNVGTWITIVGVRQSFYDDVVKYFSQYGSILRANKAPGNWIYIEYSTYEEAKKAAEAGRSTPILINGAYAVTTVFGRFKGSYQVDDLEDAPILSYEQSMNDVYTPVRGF